MNSVSTLDWVVIILYLVLSLVFGLVMARRGSQSFMEFVLSGRSLSWWLAGTSIVATTFSVDTPLYVTELVRQSGISGNWQWWAMGIGGTMGILAVTFFSKRWRRAGVATEIEFVELRYSGKAAAFLRGFKAVYFALIKNSLGIAALLIAMSRVLVINLDFPPELGTWIATGIALSYTLVSGLWGLVLTDFFQFVLAILGSIALAIYALIGVGGIEGLKSGLESAGQSGALEYFPVSGDGGTLAPILFGVYLIMTWWANPNSDGGGMFVQRMAACKNEKHAVGGSLWAIFAHYCLRSWPWILAALVSIVVLPSVDDRDAYPMLVNHFLPSGLKGLMIVAFLAAFMSTISTQLNWGASVLVNDLYKRFWAKDREDRHYVYAAQLSIILLILLPLPLLGGNTGIVDVVESILVLGAGFGPVLIARWVWWRTNAWSEVSALIASAMTTLLFRFVPEASQIAAQLLGGEGRNYETAGRLLGATVLCAAVWIPVTFLTPQVPEQVLKNFFEKLKPIGIWGKIGSVPKKEVFTEVQSWVFGIGFLFFSLFAIGDLCLANWGRAGIFSLLGVGFGVLFVNILRKAFVAEK